MRIAHVDIQNFRKLKSCRIEFTKTETIFVGANNSGKTSAMDALIYFLDKSRHKEICTTDFTLSNWAELNRIGDDWTNKPERSLPSLISLGNELLPSLDVWLYVELNEIHYVSHLIPTLDWRGGLLGVRLILMPKNLELLYRDYVSEYRARKNLLIAHKNSDPNKKSTEVPLWPKSLRHFLEKKLHKYFSVQAFLLDPARSKNSAPQDLPKNSEALEGDPFIGLMKINVINAQRPFSDSDAGATRETKPGQLSTQLRDYFDKHLDPGKLPDVSDIEALQALEQSRNQFNSKLRGSFNSTLLELEELNYPGFQNPNIILSTEFNFIDGLDHPTAVQFEINKSNEDFRLPERYNGLGYQNLISMVFSLIRFRDEWMQVGKAKQELVDTNKTIEPLHLVLIEEPEAHLHPQAQQVFIKRAYKVLTNHKILGEQPQFSTQIAVSTHSSHIAHEIEFTSLRYFKREHRDSDSTIPCAKVINLSETFGTDEETSKFVARYLRSTHCDLFFADAAILVEGLAERLLVPHFIQGKFPVLDRSYITILEIGGSHAYRLSPLFESLGILTLIVTDLDSVDNKNKVRPERNKDYKTSNNTLKEWIPAKANLDDLLNLHDENELTRNNHIRIAYQKEVDVIYSASNIETVIPYTFEDSLVLSNIDYFKQSGKSVGLIKQMRKAVQKPTLGEACTDMFEALKNGKKAEMAMELLFSTDPQTLNLPMYLKEGLEWLQSRLHKMNNEQLEGSNK